MITKHNCQYSIFNDIGRIMKPFIFIRNRVANFKLLWGLICAALVIFGCSKDPDVVNPDDDSQPALHYDGGQD